jgi:CubicO group peptidase (beta-lactamase class C family)
VKRFFRTLFAAALLLPVAVLAGNEQAAVLEEFDAYLETTAAQLGDSPFAAVVSKNGEIIYERYYDAGGALGKPVNADSRWLVFSITKSFIAALTLNLCESGEISLDDPVSKYLPEFREHGEGAFDRRNVTVRHLLSHTSGAAWHGEKAPKNLPQGFDEVHIVTEPGGDFTYSGLGMMILERTLEAVAGEDLDPLLNTRILEPLGLSASGYVYAGTPPDEVLPLRKNEYRFSENGKRAGSGLFSTARDLNAFGRLWLAPEAYFSPVLRQEAWTWHGTRASDQGRYGLMWWLLEDDGGYVMSGYQSKINAVVPETGVVITVIRYPQAKAAEDYRFSADKRAMVLFGKRL